MGVEIAIAGSTVTPSLGGLTFEQTLGSRHLCSIQWDDPTGTGLHPALGDEVIATDSSGGRAFGGLVGSVRESGLTKASIVALTREVTAYDFGGLCDQRVVTANWSSATLKTVLLDLTSDYLSTFGVSLSTSQPTGPNMGELSYDYRVLTDVLNDLQTRSGYAWNLSYDKVLLLSTAGTRTAPAAINSTNRVALQIEWEQTIENYANRQYISYGPSGDQIIDDYWTATTGQTAFPLQYSDVQAYWVVTENGVYWPVGVYGVDAMRWTWDAASTTLYSTGSTGGISYRGVRPQIFQQRACLLLVPRLDEDDRVIVRVLIHNRLRKDSLYIRYHLDQDYSSSWIVLPLAFSSTILAVSFGALFLRLFRNARGLAGEII